MSPGGDPESSGRILEALSPVYAALLALRATGRQDAEVAVILGLPPEAVAPMTELAQRKLNRLLEASHSSEE